MKSLLIVYHSTTGGTAHLAQAVEAGALEAGDVQVHLRLATEVSVGDLLAADGLVFASPEYLGSMSGVMKDLFDRTYYGALDRMVGKAYSVVVCAGSDGQGAVRQIQRIATGWRLKQIAEPRVVCVHAQTPEAIAAPKSIPSDALAQCADLGRAFAHGLSIGVF